MTVASSTLQRPMQSQEAEIHEFPDHANVLAVVHAYANEVGPMPYALLLNVMESLDALESEVAIKSAGSVRLALHRIVSDLRRLNLVELGSSGTTLTSAGTERIARWNGKFKGRSQKAREAMQELALI